MAAADKQQKLLRQDIIADYVVLGNVRLLMGGKRLVARAFSELSALKVGFVGPRMGFRILLYHSVGSRLARDSYGISITPKLFERHMALLAARDAVSIVDIGEGQRPGSGLRVAVTFDDGYKDNLSRAAPILLKHGMPFTVFVTSSFIRNQSQEFLTPNELRELAALPGVTIGAHGVTHVPLAGCDDMTLWQEINKSRRDLEDVIGRPVTAISYPHGSVNLRVASAARRAGYTVGGCSRLDINDEGRDPLLLCRTEVLAADSERIFVQKLNGAWDWYRWRARDPVSMR